MPGPAPPRLCTRPLSRAPSASLHASLRVGEGCTRRLGGSQALSPDPLRAALRPDVRGEWDEAKQHDVLFLLTIRPPDATELAAMRTQGSTALNPMELYGLAYVRGCEVIEVKDEGEHR